MPMIRPSTTSAPASIYSGSAVTLPPNLTGDYCNTNSVEHHCGYWYSNGWSSTDLNVTPDPEDWGLAQETASSWYSCMFR
jgi:hypothetical protein